MSRIRSMFRVAAVLAVLSVTAVGCADDGAQPDDVDNPVVTDAPREQEIAPRSPLVPRDVDGTDSQEPVGERPTIVNPDREPAPDEDAYHATPLRN